jgi:hypothetical protein
MDEEITQVTEIIEPVLITAHDDGECFVHDHLTHFFNTITYNNVICFSQEDKERYFKMLTEHEALIIKLYGDAVLNAQAFVPVALRNGVDNELVQQYKIWLETR